MEKRLKDHLVLLYHLMAESNLIDYAKYELVDKVVRCTSGIPKSFLNALIGIPDTDWDQSIARQKAHFNRVKIPFVWYVDDKDIQFQQSLINHGFSDEGLFRGVVGKIDQSRLHIEPLEGFSIERVQDEKTMDDFSVLVAENFAQDEKTRCMYKQFLWQMTDSANHHFVHWIAKKQGKVLSVLTTFIENELVSFWNGATDMVYRRMGLSTMLRKMALQDALLQGCKMGCSYLMAEAMALGICNKLGFETQWRFKAYVGPSSC